MNQKLAWPLAAAALALPVLGTLLGRALAARQLRRDVGWLFAQATGAAPQIFCGVQPAGLPAPVQRYFRRVLPEGQPYLRGLRWRHTGQFKTDLKKDWVAITGEQYVTADPPGFIWQGSTRWFTARDEYMAGRGALTVRLLGALAIVQGHGPHYDQGELLRWLSESVLLPTALLPGRWLRWQAVDAHSARLLFTYRGEELACLVRFNDDDELVQCETQRYFGDDALRPWVVRCAHYQEWHGVRIPTVLEANWLLSSRAKVTVAKKAVMLSAVEASLPQQ
ncbi:DUF6544 family protein [Hymenobacter nivis]|uniref:Uncharacterized protein n=1 Tax=Hymenobacter nivis TaxID=1850093 RepID=A0A2Z3GT20_9BACT|nr:DUF6544 family protein [Hymenobacter nivis]AWM32514.1 hypothetical protein DDQ68_06760 [Hymenobacter nivis]